MRQYDHQANVSAAHVPSDNKGDRKHTLGEYRVGVDFNPGRNPLVDDLKKDAAAIIDFINMGTVNPQPTIDHYSAIINSIDDKGEVEVTRLKKESLRRITEAGFALSGDNMNVDQLTQAKETAMTAIEDSAMWAVKAATKPPRIS